MKLVERLKLAEEGRSSFVRNSGRDVYVCKLEKGLNYHVKALGRIKAKYTECGR